MAKKKKRSTKGKRKQPYKLKLPKETIYTLSSTGLILIGALIMVSLSRQSPFLETIYTFFNSLFGWGIFLLPFIFLASGLMLTRLKWRITKPNVFIGSLCLLISTISLTRAGTIGREIWISLVNLINKSGTFLVLLAGIFISFVIIFETSLEDIILSLQKIIANFKKAFESIQSKKKPLFKPNDSGFTIKGMDEDDNPTQSTITTKPSVKPKTKSKPSITSAKQTSSIISNLPGAQQKMWHYPPLSLLKDIQTAKADRGDVKQNAATIERTLESFGIKAKVEEVNRGPAVTQYAIKIAEGTKLSKITSLQNDLALALAAPQGQIRIEAPIPGRSLVGLELPNRSLEIVPLSQMLSSKSLKNEKSKLAFSLGLNVSGKPVIADIDKMPHVLIAGATGSGKSVCINSIISSILFRSSPEEVKFILVDPKRVELTLYNDIPHLLTPVIVEPEKVVSALKWATSEMERRYKIFSEVGARNIASYNELSGFQALPYLVIVIDELADIILYAPSEVEDSITRLAQMARATGIHLVLATQRPSVDVLTGLIKANINCRISFNVNSMVDSRVIIDSPGAEKLLGRGDMLYIPPTQSKPTRIQGTFLSDRDTKSLIEFLKKSEFKVEYTEEVTSKYKGKPNAVLNSNKEERDSLFKDAVKMIIQYNKASASLMQRRLKIGYARAARILDQLEKANIVGPGKGAKARDILISNANNFLSQSHDQE
ncbi:MAG: DNA translocase FtsK [Patescibacteria group bacterium]|nr:DNA translocase FtsK [Patescibacteria group bacterium]